MKALAMTKSLLFVGCGEGLSDPNFENFLSWLKKVNESNEDRHYRLALEKDVEALQEKHSAEERIFVLSYGTEYSELAGYLHNLLPEHTNPVEPQNIVNTENISIPPPKTNITPCIKAYLKRLQEETQYLHLIGLGQGMQIDLPIDEAYVPLKTLVNHALAENKWGRFAKKLKKQDEFLEKDVHLSKVFNNAAKLKKRGVLLLGEPGSGKTTGALQFCWRLSSSTDRPEMFDLKPDTIPVYLRLRNLTDESSLKDFLKNESRATNAPDASSNPGDELCNHSSLLWVLDGLDEVVDEAMRVKVCKWIKETLRHRTDDYFLVTSRYQGYQGKVDLGSKFMQFNVQPLAPDQIRKFVEQWFQTAYRIIFINKLDTANEKADKDSLELLEILEKPDFQIGRLRELSTNPLLLTILCIVYHQDHNLPRGRAELYKKCVRVLLESWRRKILEKQNVKPYDPVAAERVLGRLAWQLHTLLEGEESASMEISEFETRAEKALQGIAARSGFEKDGKNFIRRMMDESGIICISSPGHCAFLHLTFQEYLAAVYILEERLDEVPAKNFSYSWWHETILLVLGQAPQSFAKKIYHHLLKINNLETEEKMFGQCLDETLQLPPEPFVEQLTQTDINPERKVFLLRLLRKTDLPEIIECCRSLDDGTDSEVATYAREILQRNEAKITEGESKATIHELVKPLAQYIDERTGMAFISIPGGKFEMGSEEYDDEKPIHSVEVSPFMIGKYSVTNEEYERFLQANPNATIPEYWNNKQFNQPRQPVVGISWEEAQNFCQWANCRLPTEAEWEYACRAATKTRFSFGDDEKDLKDYGWYDENSKGKTGVVGSKKPNPWGLYDVHGNVWEWCHDWYGKDYYKQSPKNNPQGSQSGTSRVLRGGSWGDGGIYCRSALRGGFHPSFRCQDMGFRVVLAPSSVLKDQEQRSETVRIEVEGAR